MRLRSVLGTAPSVFVAALLVTSALAGGVAAAPPSEQPAAANADHATAVVSAGPGDETTPQASDDAAPDACGFPLELTDSTGTTVTLDERPERIVTTNPSAAQTLWEVGARDRVVGVTQFAAYLDGAGEKTDVSAEGLGVSVERVVNAEPDLVLAPNASADQVADLREQGLTVYHFSAATSVGDIAEKTTTTGRLVGSCEAAAATNEEMNASVAAVENRTAEIDRPAALYPLGDGFVAGGNTFINEIMQIGGVDNVAADVGDGYPQLSNEVILETDPELIVVTDPDAPILDEKPYVSTTAGIENNYVVLDENYLNQPAPRSVIVTTDQLATAVQNLDDDADGTGETGTQAPGFGVAAAVLATLAVALRARRE
ncbi:PGF-CTERM-anchored ABC transporter substrate-binding protein [Halorubrum laminariae]|uniref:PGF-CTERM-anchored ABC transporter substrate-binding protein n=1 Tax=Halorubrum laminariae TaxID=1433523 RepID=A0ABD6BXF1_9EURY|nr:PGF-CTERM-anchored ABC transporter substrate-binding protein [Halorubrum laminariae]